MNIFKALNHFFIHGPDETGTMSDYIFFYSFLLICVTAIVVYGTKVIEMYI